LLVTTSVCRDFIEPSTASVVHGGLELPKTCLSFDVGNACLAFLNGIDIAASRSSVAPSTMRSSTANCAGRPCHTSEEGGHAFTAREPL